MKKILTLVMSAIMVLGLSVNAMAAPAKTAKVKDVTSEVSIAPETINATVGDTVTLTAESLKHGSDYTDLWEGATKTETVLRLDGYYESTATFKATAAGTYTITYSISMTAGNSGVTFTGSDSVTATVTAPVQRAVKKITIVVTAVGAVYNTQGKLTNYDVDMTATIEYTSGTPATTTQTLENVNYSSNQESRNVEVPVDGQAYTIKDVDRVVGETATWGN